MFFEFLRERRPDGVKYKDLFVNFEKCFGNNRPITGLTGVATECDKNDKQKFYLCVLIAVYEHLHSTPEIVRSFSCDLKYYRVNKNASTFFVKDRETVLLSPVPKDVIHQVVFHAIMIFKKSWIQVSQRSDMYGRNRCVCDAHKYAVCSQETVE